MDDIKIAAWTPADWDAVPSYMFGDQDKPVEQCNCRSCQSEGYYDADDSCLHYEECNAEAGRHGERCQCDLS